MFPLVSFRSVRAALLMAAVLLASSCAAAQLAEAAPLSERVVLSTGHTDAVAPHYEAGELTMRVKDDTGDDPVVRDPDEVLFHAKDPESRATIPDDPSIYPNFAFLGEPGATVWILPMVQNPELLWPGFSSEAIGAGLITGEELSWSLRRVSGPGEFFLFEESAFGLPIMSFRSDEPLPQQRSIPTQTHAHYNWAFTAPGLYTLTYEVRGTPIGGQEVTTGETDYKFFVGDLADLPPDDQDPPPADEDPVPGDPGGDANPPGGGGTQPIVAPRPAAPATPRPLARLRLTGARLVEGRKLRLGIRLERKARVRVTVRRRGKVVAKAAPRRVAAGKRRLRLRLDRRLERGRYTVVVQAGSLVRRIALTVE